MNAENIRPKACCDVGSYGCQVPMPLNGRIQGIDYCIADIVAALNAANIRTVASCCGHNKCSASIVLEDGREVTIGNPVRPWDDAHAKWSLEAKVVRQEKLTSALWGFAHDLQNEPHNAKSADGTTVSLSAVGRAQEIILGLFGQRRIELQ